MGFLDTILRPLEIVVADIMVVWHYLLTFIGIPSASGAAWGLSIVGLVVTIRIILIPLFVKQIKSSRAMQMIAPELKAVQAKYKGKKDSASREAMSRETMELYSKHKTNPFASCLPMLVQAPIFFALFRVLNYKLKAGPDGVFAGIGWLTPKLAEQADSATIFGAPISAAFLRADGNIHVQIVATVLIVMMVSTTFLTQRQLTQKNMPASALEGPMAQQQKVLMYILPFIFVISGPNFPIGVLIYWTTTNLWTMGQQFYVIRRNPTPGSDADKAYKARLAAKAAKKGLPLIDSSDPKHLVIEAGESTDVSRQREQPNKKKPKKKR
jgi:YidC/Oxa1 family membrane protein insertase